MRSLDVDSLFTNIPLEETMSFTIENEKQNRTSFLDVQIIVKIKH